MASSRHRIRLGYVPLIDSAPLLVAQEWGYFREAGLNVSLIREPGWATIRDKVAYGELEGAHALAGLCFALSWGLGTIQRLCLTGFLFNSHGDAITLSRKLLDAGVSSSLDLADYVRETKGKRPVTFGIPHQFSSHHFLLRLWLRAGGIDPAHDVEVIALPPSQMNACLMAGHLDGFAVGEPFNTVAAHAGLGDVVATSVDLVPLHPEKAFLVPASFLEERPEEHQALLLVLEKACARCETPEGKREAAAILARSECLNLDESVLLASLEADRPEFHLFHGEQINRPSLDKANWLVSQMRSAGMLGTSLGEDLPGVADIFRPDLYEAIIDPEEPAAIA